MRTDTLVIYHYFEKDSSYVDNFFHFLRFGYSEDCDYVVLVAGVYSIELPALDNLRYIFTENKNNDFGGYCEVIRTSADILDYDYFFFINSSVRGPFAPINSGRFWTSYFLEQLEETIGLVGSTINILPSGSPHSVAYKEKYGGNEPYSHVQTMAYAMPKKTLAFLIENKFFDVHEALSKDDVIRDYELRLSQLIIGNGWNIKCLLPEYNVIDYRRPHSDVNPTSVHGDPSFSCAYFGRTAHPHEVIFVKINRNIFTLKYLERLAYTAHVETGASIDILCNKNMEKYVQKLERASVEKEAVPFNPTQLTGEQILGLTKMLLENYPHLSPYVEQLIVAARSKK